MDIGGLREFAGREWGRVAESDREHWAERYRREGYRSTTRVAHALFEHARRVRPDFPGADYSDKDLANQIRVKELVDRAAAAFPVRRSP